VGAWRYDGEMVVVVSIHLEGSCLLKHKVWGWLLLRDNEHVFWKCQFVRDFWSWFHAEFQSMFVAPLSWKGLLLGDTWMVKGNCKLLWLLIHVVAIGFLRKHHFKVTFNGGSSTPFSWGFVEF
jgi:hypothetical protein